MSKKLLIVESPAKAKTIEKILGKDFSVKSSFGHIRDLDKGNDAIDVSNNFEPKYVISPEKLKVVKELRENASKADEVWLATDEDREGEAISWHLCEVLNLDIKKTPRIVFHEITKPAIQKAVANPRYLDIDLVNAQQARRLLDRLVGYELSEVLWRKIKGKLSAGRVQSVAVKLIVEREREIQRFSVEDYYKVTALFDAKDKQGQTITFKSTLSEQFKDVKGAESFLNNCINAHYTVSNVEVKPVRRKPAAPFTTSTLQQEASRKLGFSVKRTMIAAQRLYEAGFITYMRTDSTNMSETALVSIADEIKKTYGDNYLETRRYKTRNESAQEAHEAVRPTYIENKDIDSDNDGRRLYELVWRRTIASQMSDAQIEKTIIDIDISSNKAAKFVATGEVLKFDGFLKVYLESKDDEEDEENQKLPPLKIGDKPLLNEMTAVQSFTRPPSRYTEAGLVKKLEELGIGRPSTYVPTISKIMEEDRGYVTRESREGAKRKYTIFTLKDNRITAVEKEETTGTTKNRLYAGDMGVLVTDFLEEHFKDVMDYKFTAEMEKDFDKIASGDIEWQRILKEFYGPFHKDVNKTIEEASRASGERILGIDPESGRTILVRLSRFGKPIIQIGKPEELAQDEKPRFANLKPGQSLDSITIEDAFEQFKLPQTLGELEGNEVVVAIGRFGPYIKYGDLFVNIPKDLDPLEVTMDDAIALINEKQKADAPIGMLRNQPVTKGKGRFGPFVKWGDLYVNIPRAYDFDHITIQQATELIDTKLDKEANRYIKQWAEEKISVENGRWGPYIRFGKLNIKLPKKEDNTKYSADDCLALTLDDVKKMIETDYPEAFAPKKAAKNGSAKTTAKKK